MVPYRPWVIHHMSLTRITVNGKIQQRTCGGVGAPVGLTVFKTAGGSLGAVPGGFDSHTPLPGTTVCMLRFPSLTRKSITFHRLLGKSPRERATSTTFSKDSSSAPSEKSSTPSEKIWGQLCHYFHFFAVRWTHKTAVKSPSHAQNSKA
jgi:hypothetical protein